MSKFYLSTLCLYFNILCLVLCEPLPRQWVDHYEFEDLFKDNIPEAEGSGEENSVIINLDGTIKTEIDTTGLPESDVTDMNPETEQGQTSTTEISIDTTTTSQNIKTTTTSNGVRHCPKEQSSFSKADLVVLIHHVVKKINIMVSINDSYHDTAIIARDKLAKEFDGLRDKINERPKHLHHVIEDIDSLRQTKVEPLAEIALASIKELPAVENNFNQLFNKTTQMLQELEYVKNICKWNCNHQFRSSVNSKKRRQVSKEPHPLRQDVPSPNNDQVLCSTLEDVYNTVKEQLMKFEQEEITALKKEISDEEDLLSTSIKNLSISLREAAVNQFGTTMYDILSIYDDYYHFMRDLEDFNKQSLIRSIKKSNMNVEYRLLDLYAKIQDSKRQCLACNFGQRRASKFSKFYDLITGLIEGNEKTKPEAVTDENGMNILNQLISDKFQQIKAAVQGDLQKVFSNLRNAVNDTKLADKTVTSLKPIQESVNVLVQQRKQELQALLNEIPKESIVKIQNLYQDSINLAKDIDRGMKSLSQR